MKIKTILLALLIFLFSIQINSQTTVQDIVNKGIEFHDQGKYEEAIKEYKKALKIDSKSILANYEIAFSYSSLKKYKKCIKHADKVLDQNADNMIGAYVMKGSALDLMGKTKKSIKVFEKAIATTEGHYLLYYNLSLNYLNTQEYYNAIENAVRAIEMNQNHSSSHLLLAKAHNELGNPIQSILASHFFLVLEPNSDRSPETLEMLQNNMKGNISKNPDDENSTKILINSSSGEDFGAAEILLAMLTITKDSEENEGKTSHELFIENTNLLFSSLGSLNEEKPQDIWWSLYIPFLQRIGSSEHHETYCNYIAQSGSEIAKTWLDENTEKLDLFDLWLQN